MSQQRFRGVPVTTINGPTVPSRAPYDRLRAIIAAAHAGELQPEPRKDRESMHIGEVIERPDAALTAKPKGKPDPATIALVETLLDAGPMRAVEITATDREMRSLHQSVSRRLHRLGYRELRPSYTRIGMGDGTEMVYALMIVKKDVP